MSEDLLAKEMKRWVRFYQRKISPLFPPSCRYYPTCSNYMIQSLDRFGTKGFLMGISRILRCHPFAEGGIDPVPDHFSLKRNRLPSKEEEKIMTQLLIQNIKKG